VFPANVLFVTLKSEPFDMIAPPPVVPLDVFPKNVEFTIITIPFACIAPPPPVALVFPETVELYIRKVLVEKFCIAPPADVELLSDIIQLMIVRSAGTDGLAAAALFIPPPRVAVFPVIMEFEITAVPPTL
jgi:hypothetical protein